MKVIITMMENNKVFFIKKVHIKTQSKKKDVLSSLHCKKRRVSIYLTKTVLKRTSSCIFNMEKVDLEESLLNR